MPNIKRTIKKVARRAKAPAKRIAKAAARQAVRELRGGARSLIARNPLLNAGVRSLTGQGDYVHNALVKSGSHVPSFGRSRIVMSRREFLGTVVSSTTPGNFKITKFTVNPGDSKCFPWLSTICQNFESYRPYGIVFEYKATSGESVGSTNTALGVVAMASQYNSFAADPVTRVQLEAFPGAVSVAPFQDALCGIECKSSDRQSSSLLIRNAYSGNVGNGAYNTLFDVGDFFIASEGCQGSGVTLGELWVTYKIELFNPILPPPTFNLSYGVAVTSSSPGNLNACFVGSVTATGIAGFVKNTDYNATFQGTTLASFYRLLVKAQVPSSYSLGSVPTPTIGSNGTVTNVMQSSGASSNGWLFFSALIQATGSSTDVDFSISSVPTSQISVTFTPVPSNAYW